MEKAILDFFQAVRQPSLDIGLSIFTRLGNLGEIWIFLALLICLNRDKRMKRIGYTALVAIGIQAILVNLVMKPLIMRVRPYELYQVALYIKPPHGTSFPSGHTATAFAFAAVLFHTKYRTWKEVMVLAIMMGITRLYFYVHFPTDVLAGAIIGWLVGYACYYFMIKKQPMETIPTE